MKNLQAIVLAAGKSTRFKTEKSKLLHTICGQEMILYPLNTLASLDIPTMVVTGYQREKLQRCIQNKYPDAPIQFVEQKEQKGTGHAIACTQNCWNSDAILIMNGDMPLVSQEIIAELHKKHVESDATISFVMAHNADPTGKSYERVIKADNTTEIIEAKHFDGDPHEHCYINAGIYLVNRSFLQQAIDSLKENELTREFYITDLVKLASEQGKTVATTHAPFDRIRGINTLQELWAVEQVKRSDLIRYWMDQGVRFTIPQNVHLDLDITIGPDTIIGGGVHILKKSSIGAGCTINEFSSVENSTIDNNSTIQSHCLVKNATIGKNTTIGPFAHIRANTVIKDHAAIGNFVEIKQSTIGSATTIKHLSYIGDATVGNNVNIGAGTITCNYDGFEKHPTTIGDGAHIGSNNSLVAPVSIQDGSITGAGSVITNDVPADALAIARSRQVNKPEYAKKIKHEREKKKNQNENNDRASFLGAIKTDNSTYSSQQ